MRDKFLYRANSLPVLQNKTFETLQEALLSPRGDVALVVDHTTGLVKNAEFDGAKLIYDECYQNEQACSSSFQSHLEDVTSVIDKYFKGRPIVEIGCGKAHYLNHLRGRGYDAIGVDPSFEGASPYVIKARYSRDLGLKTGTIVLRHVLEHIDDPIRFLLEIQEGNGGSGLIYIEVPCFDWICSRRAWFDVFYEHVNYFRLSDFYRMFAGVIAAGRLFGDQYIYVVADLATLQRPVANPRDAINFPADFTASIDRYRGLPNEPRAIWGGASKGVTFAVNMNRLGVNIDCAIDINPAKQGRYLPCSGVRVVSPETGMSLLPKRSDILVMNSNYLNEIKEMSGNEFNYKLVE